MEAQGNNAAIQKLQKLVRDVSICMLVTTDDTGKIFSRPMTTITVDDEGYLWFLTNEFSETIHEVSQDNSLTLVYAHPGKNIYVHINGTSTVIVDREKIRSLWTPSAQAWFPAGVDDPKLCALKVKVEEGHHWNNVSNKMLPFYTSPAVGQNR